MSVEEKIELDYKAAVAGLYKYAEGLDKATSAGKAVAASATTAAKGTQQFSSACAYAVNGGSKFANSMIAAASAVSLVRDTFRGIQAATAPFADAMNRAGRVDDLSTMTGETVGNLIVLERALKNSGRSGADIAPLFSRIAMSLESASNKSSGAAKAFSELGIDVDVFSSLKPAKQVEALQSALAKLQDPLARAAVAIQLFGRSGTEMLPLLSARTAFSRARNEVGGYAKYMESVAARQKRLGEDFSLVGDRMKEAWTRLLNVVTPTLEAIAAGINSIPIAALETLIVAGGAASAVFAAIKLKGLIAQGIAMTAMLGKKAAAWLAVAKSADTAAAAQIRAGAASKAGAAAGLAKGGLGTAALIAGAFALTASGDSEKPNANARADYLKKMREQAAVRREELGDFGMLPSEEAVQERLDEIDAQIAAYRPKLNSHDAEERTIFGGSALNKGEVEKLTELREYLKSKQSEIIAEAKITAEKQAQAKLQRESAKNAETRAKSNDIRQSLDEAAISDAIGAEKDPARRKALMQKQAEIYSRNLSGSLKINNPQDLMGAYRERVNGLTRSIASNDGNAEGKDAQVKELERLKGMYSQISGMERAWNDEKRANAERALEVMRIQQEGELEQLERNYAAKYLSSEQYEEARLAMQKRIHAAEAALENSATDQARRQIEKQKLQWEIADKTAERIRSDLEEQNKNRPENKNPNGEIGKKPTEVSGDRLSRMGLFVGNVLQAPLNYLRKTAGGVDSLVKEVQGLRKDVRSQQAESVGSGLAD